MNNKIKSATILMLLAAVGGGWLFFNKHQAEGENLHYSPITVTRSTIEEAVTAQGKLEPKEYVDVGAQVSGQLRKIHFTLGDTVKAGDLLAEIDPQLYQSRVAANEARLKTMRAQETEQAALVRQARQKMERSAALIKSKAISVEIFEDAETALKVADAQQTSLQAQIEEIQSTLEGDKASLNYTNIYAPISGTVVLQNVREGQTLNASQSAPTLVQLANLDVMTVRAQVAEADVPRLKEGMPVYFTTLGSRDRKWEGRVRQILPSPEVINDVVLYNVLVDVDNKDRGLMTGMSTQMFFVLGRAENVPVLPLSALGKRVPKEDTPQGQAYRVRAMSAGKAAEKTIYVGLMDRAHAEIRAGLKEGDTVAVTTAPATSPQQGGGGFSRGPRL